MLFFFSETGTNDIYTYGHTLALHDALPISRSFPPPTPPSVRGSPAIRNSRPENCRAVAPAPAPAPRSASGWQDAPPPRSDEHTSELQSLMRISYAAC